MISIKNNIILAVLHKELQQNKDVLDVVSDATSQLNDILDQPIAEVELDIKKYIITNERRRRVPR